MRKSLNFDQVNQLVLEALPRIEELFIMLGLDLKVSGNRISGTCPCHDSDSNNSFTMYLDGYVPCLWKCWTRHCEGEFGKNLTGLIRGVLTKQTESKKTFWDAAQWLEKFVGRKIDEIKLDHSALERLKFVRQAQLLSANINVKTVGIPRKTVRKNLKVPAEYYLKRGYSKEILDTYDIGLCDKPDKEMSNRVVFPCYNLNNEMIGCVGRTVEENYKDQKIQKWKNSYGFNTGGYFFNYWNALNKIRQTKVATLVESQGDVLRLEEAGINNSLGIFGSSLTDKQEIILESSGAMALILLFNNDHAGTKCRDDVIERLGRFYNIYVPEFQTNDIGDLPVNKVQGELMPYIDEIVKQYSNL